METLKHVFETPICLLNPKDYLLLVVLVLMLTALVEVSINVCRSVWRRGR